MLKEVSECFFLNLEPYSLVGILSTFSLVILTLHRNFQTESISVEEHKNRVKESLKSFNEMIHKINKSLDEQEKSLENSKNILEVSEISKTYQSIEWKRKRVKEEGRKWDSLILEYPFKFQRTTKGLKPSVCMLIFSLMIPSFLWILSILIDMEILCRWSGFLRLLFFILYLASGGYVLKKIISLCFHYMEDQEEISQTNEEIRSFKNDSIVLEMFREIDKEKVRKFEKSLDSFLK